MLLMRWLISILFVVLFLGVNSQSNPSLPLVFYRGTQYAKIINPQYGTPFLYDDTPGRRRVEVVDHWYQGMELHYDAEDDHLITVNPAGDIRIQLVREKVKSFMIGEKLFRRVADLGFFEVMYEGRHSVLIKWQNVMIRKAAEDPYYKLYNKVFVLGPAGMKEVTGKDDLLRYMGRNKRSAQEFIRSQQLNFRKELPRAAAELMKYGDASGFTE
jgi:hypothetical protein